MVRKRGTGNNCGNLIVWSLLSGSMAAECLHWSGEVYLIGGIKLLKQSSLMQLICGSITWISGKSGSSSGSGILVKDIVKVELLPKNIFSIVVTGNQYFRFECNRAEEAVEKIQQCISYFHLKEKKVLWKKATRQITHIADSKVVVPVFSLAKIDGNAWSLDGRLCLTEWAIEVNHAGVLRGVLDIHPQRTLQLDSSALKSDRCALQPVGLWSVGEREVWVGVGSQFIRVIKSSSLVSEGPPLLQKDFLKNQWAKLPPNACANDLMIMCAVVVGGFMNGRVVTEVWESTCLGVIFVWNVEEGVVNRVIEVRKTISTMLVVEDEVGGLLCTFFSHLSFSLTGLVRHHHR